MSNLKTVLLSAATCIVFGSVAMAAPVTTSLLPRNYTPKPVVQNVGGTCTQNCYPTYGGGSRCTTQCY